MQLYRNPHTVNLVSSRVSQTVQMNSCSVIKRGFIMFQWNGFVIITLDNKFDPHAWIKFCLKFSTSFTETFEILQAFGEHSFGRTRVFEKNTHFKDGRVSAQNNEHSGRPITNKTSENMEKFGNSSKRIVTEQFIRFLIWLNSVMESAGRFSRETWTCSEVCLFPFNTRSKSGIAVYDPKIYKLQRGYWLNLVNEIKLFIGVMGAFFKT